MSNSIDQARYLLQQGRTEEARDLLKQIIKANPRNETAWLTLIPVLPTQKERIDALTVCLRFNPESEKASQALKTLQGRDFTADYDVRSNALRKQSGTRARSLSASRLHPGGDRPSGYINSFRKKFEFTRTEWRVFFVLVILCALIFTALGAIVLSTAAEKARGRRASATATAEHQACVTEFEDVMLSLLSEFFRQQSIADTTARINLPEQIARLEDIRNRAWNMPSKTCNSRWHALLIDYMDKSIDSFLSFSADDPDYVWMDKYLDNLEALIKLDDAVIASGRPGGLVEMFRQRGYYYWEKLDEPDWKDL